MATQRKTIPLAGTCPARGELTLATKRIRPPFTVRRIRASFPPGCQDHLALAIYLSEDPTCPASGPPTGLSILQEYAATDTLKGDGETKDLETDLPQPLGGTWLKVYAANTDWYDHAVDVLLTVDLAEIGA